MHPPLALYIHWPFCRKKCPYCDFNSHVRAEVDTARWQRALLAELENQAARLPLHRVDSIFFGGGTPSLMPPDIVGALIERAKALFPTDNNLEVTLEANPTSSEAAKFRAFRDAGVNRLSVGVQSLDPEALRFLGREHDPGEALAAVALARETFPRCSFDLIYARPGQTLEHWLAELDAALDHAPDHLSLYQLTVEPETPFSRWHEAGGFILPEESDAARLYDTTIERCAARGLHAYEISNFAAPGKECRHNLHYWRGTPYLGIGPGAHGRLRRADGWHATATIRSPERWLDAVERQRHGLESDELLTPLERGEELVLTGLRLTDGIEPVAFSEATGLSLEEVVPATRRMPYLTENLLTETSGRLIATSEGRRMLNALLGALLT